MAACSPLVIAHTQLSLGNREVEKDSGKNFFGSVTLCCAIAPHQAVAATLVSAFNLHEPYDDAENFAPNRFHPAIWSSFWRVLPVLCNWSGLKVFQNWRRVLQSPTVLLKDIVHENRLSLPPRGASPPLISVGDHHGGPNYRHASEFRVHMRGRSERGFLHKFLGTTRRSSYELNLSVGCLMGGRPTDVRPNSVRPGSPAA